MNDHKQESPDLELSWQTFLGNQAQSPLPALDFTIARSAFIAAWYASRAYSAAHTRAHGTSNLQSLLMRARSEIRMSQCTVCSRHGYNPNPDCSNCIDRLALENDLLSFPVETSVALDYKLPCEVRVAPGMSIGKGCPLSTLMHALRQREGQNVEFVDERAMAVRRALTELRRPVDGVTVSNEHEHATYVASPPPETEVPHTAHCVNRIEDIGCDCGSGHKPDCQLATAVCTCGADAPASPVKSNCNSSASTDDGAPPSRTHPTSSVECPKCRTQLAFEGDECGLCKEDEA